MGAATISIALAIVTTVIAVLIALLSHGYHRRQAIRLWEREKRLPDATRYDNLRFLVEQLQRDYDSLKDGVHDARETIDEAQRMREWMEATRDEVSQLEQQKGEVVRIQAELEKKQLELASATEKLNTSLAEYKEVQHRVEELTRELGNLKSQHDLMSAQLKRAAEIRDELSVLEEMKKSLQYELERLERTVRQLSEKEAELERRQHEVDRLREEELQLRREVSNLQSAIDQAKSVIQDLRDQERKRDAVITEMKELEANANKLRDQLQSELRNLKRECADLEQQRDSRKTRLDELDKQIEDLNRKRSDLDREQRDLQQQVKELEGKAAALNGQIPTLQSAFDHLSSAIHQTTDSPDLSASELWHPVLAKGELRKRGKCDELELLEGVQHELKSLGLKFDNRTVFAFHTALKTTSSSPLVTLAGVSGTGKSELPRRYADAQGMNFLNVAVQPRWDSPQDLFGFYDYLERRFRPTELTRALLQMDPIGAKAERGWQPPKEFEVKRCHDQMLLVLLDEMNLARVEYYFSEFLSKLETRRGVDPANERDRERAEIVLEVGGRRASAVPLRLFVDTNVLFVGTMNEDESTQALSDKVIDRSNILRFGSPNSIEPIEARNGHGYSAKSAGRLSKEQWRGWYRSPDSLSMEDRRQLLQWIGDLRSAMDSVGRPFAYRVAHAMLEYAANYPEVDQRLESAISDQIEQRILPKLVGLDVQHGNAKNVLNAISKILDATNDDKLRVKIDATSREDYFQWTGLDRTVV